MSRIPVTLATPDRLPALAAVLGRAFARDPMIQWPLEGHGTVEVITAMFGFLYEEPVRLGVVWEAGDAEGVASWIPPGRATELMDADRRARQRFAPLVPDGGVRYQAMWDWLESRVPDEPLWYLDAVAVDPARQRTGVGSALVRHGLALAAAEGLDAFLETSRAGNLAYYERFGFEVVDEGDAPDGGPHIWFMRAPATAATREP